MQCIYVDTISCTSLKVEVGAKKLQRTPKAALPIYDSENFRKFDAFRTPHCSNIQTWTLLSNEVTQYSNWKTFKRDFINNPIWLRSKNIIFRVSEFEYSNVTESYDLTYDSKPFGHNYTECVANGLRGTSQRFDQAIDWGRVGIQLIRRASRATKRWKRWWKWW